MRAILFSGGIALLLSLLGTRLAIYQFTKWGYGQEIREDGPTTHRTKRGTPTMGGVAILVAALLGYFAAKAITGHWPTASALLLLFLFVGMGLVGFLDDFIKVYKQRNLGLRSKAKIIGQTLVAVVFGVLALWPALENDAGITPASHHLSFIRDWDPGWELPTLLVLVLFWVMITGTSNATNLTDGLDGLLAGCSVMVFGAYTLVNIWQNNQSCLNPGAEASTCYGVRDPLDLAILGAAITGAVFGFLWWNAAPARIFMGDTGSLALGSALAGLAILSRTEFLLVVLGGLFLLETLSVIMQVGYFKVTKGKRLLRMAPIHHHFEMVGWEQITVVIRFWILTGVCVMAGLGIFYAEWVTGSGL